MFPSISAAVVFGSDIFGQFSNIFGIALGGTILMIVLSLGWRMLGAAGGGGRRKR